MQTCAHCDETILNPVYARGTAGQAGPFCCAGCLTVYEVIRGKGLSDYYTIKQSSALFRQRAPVETRSGRYDYLDEASFRGQYTSRGGLTLELYLEGIHCLACLWLVEKLPELCPEIRSAKLDLERSVVTLIRFPEGKFAPAARQLEEFGYSPHPLKRDDAHVDLRSREERQMLMRIGVAGAAAGNIMLYAVSLYGGAAGDYAALFNGITVVLGVPVLTYSAFPFYRNAWLALKNKQVSIDIPISLALVTGLVMGLVNLGDGVAENYFDSLSALVFLLLLSRYFLRCIQQQGLTPTDMHFFYRAESAQRVTPTGELEEVHLDLVRVGDVLQVERSVMIPVDGEVTEGRSSVNNSFLTGEARPVDVGVGEKVFGGTLNLEAPLRLRVEAKDGDTRLGSILENVEQGWSLKSRIVTLTARVSHYFTLTVFGLAVLVFLYRWSDLGLGPAFEMAITLLIVTCPCALALATPLTFIRALSLAAKNGVIIKSDEVIERLAQVKHVVLDKTGTVTFGKPCVTEVALVGEPQHSVWDIIWTLEAQSRHPLAKALREYVSHKRPKLLEVRNYAELLGQGVEGEIGDHSYRIDTRGIWEDQKLVALYSYDDAARPDSKDSIVSLRDLDLSVHLLSGDRMSVVAEIGYLVGLHPSEWTFGALPEKKAEVVSGLPFSLMVGDGANDAVALGRAHVGVAVAGAMDVSLRAADVYLTTPGIAPVAQLLSLAHETMKVVRRNLVLSLLYNGLSVLAVFTGHITPLVAAVIMPLSSLTVLLSSLWGTQRMRALWK